MPIDASLVVWDDEPVKSGGIDPAQVQWDDSPTTDLPAVKAEPPDFSGVTARVVPNEPEGGFLRDVAMGGRSVLQGAGGLIGALGLDAANHYLVPGEQPTYREAASQLADKIGLPKPSTAKERVLGDVGEALTGTALTMGVGGALSGAPATQRLGSFLSAQPALQAASTAAGAGAAGAVRESGGGQGAQLAAGVAGGLAPAGIVSGVPAAVRGAIRGGEAGRQRVAENIRAFGQAGTAPSVGQATESGLYRGIEQTLSRVPGAAGVMNSRAARQAEQIGEGLEATASSLSPRTTAGEAGRAVQRGITGAGGFIEQRKATASQLYDAIDQFIPPTSAVPLPETRQALQKLTSLTPGAESTTAMLNNPKIARINEALGADMLANQYLSGQHALPYGAVKDLRSRVGKMLEGSELIAEAPKAELKQLYGALTRDMESAAQAAGPEAASATKRANNYYKALQSRVDLLDSAINKNGGPEKVFNALWSGAKDGDTTLRAVMQSLPKDAQKDLGAAFVRRLGRANPGAQNEAGDAFSAAAFLTNWNRMSPEAKRTVFNRFGPGFSDNMNKIAKVAGNLREGSQTFANPSGTSAAGAQIAGITSFITSLATGNVGLAGGIAGGAGTANLWARAMTNPRFVAWLANQTDKPIGAIPAQANVLRGIAERQDEPELAEVADLIESGYQSSQQAPGDQ